MNEGNCFFELLQTALGTQQTPITFTRYEWEACYEQAAKHSLLAIVFPVVQKYLKNEIGQRIEPLFSQWLATIVQVDERNRLLNERAEWLSCKFNEWGHKTCILKGQGVARLYPSPELRQGGDIDIWVEGSQDETVKCLRDNYIVIRHIDYVHSETAFFDDVEVETHFRPSWMYNPFKNRRLQRFFRENARAQFDNLDDIVGFAYPTIGFNLVYSLIHINRHIFEEGIGLRQLLDYYYILMHSSKEERDKAFSVICDLCLRKFAGAIMYIEGKVFSIDRELMLCAPNEKEGSFLLSEIMRGGNFGRYDERNKWFAKNQRIGRGLFNLKRNLRYMTHYPSEVLWIPIWKVWHWCWRKWKGYL